jgi:hypothetical protein
MVIDIIDFFGVALGKAENHSPVSPNGDRPKAFIWALSKCNRNAGKSM